MRANISVIALVTSGLVASCFYGSATLIDSPQTGGTGGNSSQGGQTAAGSGGLPNNAGTSNSTRTAGSGGKAPNTIPSAGVAGIAGTRNAAGAGGNAISGGAGVGGRSITSVAGNAGSAGSPNDFPSCRGLDTCNGESCCTSLLIPGGTFPRGSTDGEKECVIANTCDTSEMPEANVKISSFYLDKYEVTVGRFRQFLNAYDATKPPQPGDGANPSVTSVTTSTTGWSSAWNNKLLPKNKLVESLASSVCQESTWPASGTDNERYPLNCIDWYTAFAFCIWDGGRLPTETEWEYVAAGGDQNRIYPWGDTAPTTELAWYYANKLPLLNVGSKPAGAGRWNHVDLAGSVFEWTLDSFNTGWYATANSKLDNPVSIANTEVRSARGGSATDGATSLRAAARYGSPDANLRSKKLGVRCARNAK